MAQTNWWESGYNSAPPPDTQPTTEPDLRPKWWDTVDAQNQPAQTNPYWWAPPQPQQQQYQAPNPQQGPVNFQPAAPEPTWSQKAMLGQQLPWQTNMPPQWMYNSTPQPFYGNTIAASAYAVPTIPQKIANAYGQAAGQFVNTALIDQSVKNRPQTYDIKPAPYYPQSAGVGPDQNNMAPGSLETTKNTSLLPTTPPPAPYKVSNQTVFTPEAVTAARNGPAKPWYGANAVVNPYYSPERVALARQQAALAKEFSAFGRQYPELTPEEIARINYLNNVDRESPTNRIYAVLPYADTTKPGGNGGGGGYGSYQPYPSYGGGGGGGYTPSYQWFLNPLLWRI